MVTLLLMTPEPPKVPPETVTGLTETPLIKSVPALTVVAPV